VHFDSYVNNPASSKRFLGKIQGDVGTYLKLREQRYVRLARPDLKSMANISGMEKTE
jgi:hypothetical protein